MVIEAILYRVTPGNHLPWPFPDALIVARKMLAGERGVIEGSVVLATYAHDMVPDWRADPDFVIFGALASETDHLPFGEVRGRWSSAGLAKADVEIDAITEAYRNKVDRSDCGISREEVAEMAKLGTGVCEACLQTFNYSLIHNGFNDTACAYCDKCGETVFASGWSKDIPTAAKLKLHGPVNPGRIPLERDVELWRQDPRRSPSWQDVGCAQRRWR